MVPCILLFSFLFETWFHVFFFSFFFFTVPRAYGFITLFIHYYSEICRPSHRKLPHHPYDYLMIIYHKLFRTEVGIDSFKFDAGESNWLPSSYILHPAEDTASWPGVFSTRHPRAATLVGRHFVFLERVFILHVTIIKIHIE